LKQIYTNFAASVESVSDLSLPSYSLLRLSPNPNRHHIVAKHADNKPVCDENWCVRRYSAIPGTRVVMVPSRYRNRMLR